MCDRYVFALYVRCLAHTVAKEYKDMQTLCPHLRSVTMGKINYVLVTLGNIPSYVMDG